MIVRHTETRVQEPSVRFYRTIALTFLIITVGLLGFVIFITSKKAVITVIAKEDSKSINISANLDNLGESGKIKGVVTTTIFFSEEKYFPTGSKSMTGVAEGEVTIYNKSNVEQVLVKTTRLLNPDGVLFRLSDRVVVPANGEIIAKVYADKEGVESEIGPSQFIIPGLNVERQKFVYAESKSKMAGGTRLVGFLSESDLNNAKTDYADKVKKSATDLLIGTNWDSLGKIALVVSQTVSSDKNVGEEIDGFVLSGTSTLIIVGYDRLALANLVSKEMSQKINVGSERVLSVGGEPVVSILGYDLANYSAQLSIKQEAVVTLDPDAETLLPRNFTGKSADEIKRYLVGLDHVTEVDVKLSPSWIRKAPTVPDHIKVIVKSIK